MNFMSIELQNLKKKLEHLVIDPLLSITKFKAARGIRFNIKVVLAFKALSSNCLLGGSVIEKVYIHLKKYQQKTQLKVAHFC